MLLNPPEAELFFTLHRALMFFVNQQLNILPDIKTVDEYSGQSPEARLKVHQDFLDDIDLIEKFIDENPFGFSDDELEIVHSWHHLISDKFYIVRYLTKHTVFLSSEDQPIAYGVLALTDPIEEMIGPYLPVMVETALLPFKGKIVYDSILGSFNISFGAGIRRSLKDCYEDAKQRLGIVTLLTINETNPVAKRKSAKKAAKSSKPYEFQKILGVIVGMIDQFCRDHLNEEYAKLCHKLPEGPPKHHPILALDKAPTTQSAC